MNLCTELERFNSTEELKKWVQALLDRVQKEAAETAHQLERYNSDLQLANIKIQALTHELAYYRRIRFGAKSEVLRAATLDFFHDTMEEDIAAAKAKLEQEAAASNVPEVATSPRKPREKAGRQPLPDHLPRCIHIHEPESLDCT